MRIYRFAFLILMALAAACSGGQQQQQETSEGKTSSDEKPKMKFPVFSLFDNTGKEGFQLYRNGNRQATITVDSACCIKALRAYKDDCYILVSARSTGNMRQSEILKNGRPAMTFDTSFLACDMAMDKGHFVVMGYNIHNSNVIVYRDGIDILSIKSDCHYGNPCKVGIFQDDVFVAFQKGDSVLVTREGAKISSIPGKCKDFQVSHMGYYTLTDSSLYRDTDRVMRREFFRHADKEMFATPSSISLTDNLCYTCAQSTFDDIRTYGVVYRNQEAYIMLKPDSKHLGESALETVCAGVAANDFMSYSAYYKINADKTPVEPVIYQYMYDKDDCFSIDFGFSQARLLFMDTSR